MYPTKEKILENGITQTDTEVVKIIKNWKFNSWILVRKKGEEAKFLALKSLIIQIADMMGKPSVKVEYQPSESSCRYNPITHTIVINQ